MAYSAGAASAVKPQRLDKHSMLRRRFLPAVPSGEVVVVVGTHLELLHGVLAHEIQTYGPVYTKPAQYTGWA